MTQSSSATGFSTNGDKAERKHLAQLTAEHFQNHSQQVWQRADRRFAGLMAFGRNWRGPVDHPSHLDWSHQFDPSSCPCRDLPRRCHCRFPDLAGFFASGAGDYPPCHRRRSNARVALLIHLTGGRIETHFQIFGSLAFLAFYRDWRVLVTATIVVAFDHFLRRTYWPQSVFGTITPDSFRWMEHAGWVLFEDVFLLIMCHQSVAEMRVIAGRQAELELTNDRIELAVKERTHELDQTNHELGRKLRK
jgi:hypothetical protein